MKLKYILALRQPDKWTVKHKKALSVIIEKVERHFERELKSGICVALLNATGNAVLASEFMGRQIKLRRSNIPEWENKQPLDGLLHALNMLGDDYKIIIAVVPREVASKLPLEFLTKICGAKGLDPQLSPRLEECEASVTDVERFARDFISYRSFLFAVTYD